MHFIAISTAGNNALLTSLSELWNIPTYVLQSEVCKVNMQ